jgi:uncharacterized protein (TIGR03000 family)
MYSVVLLTALTAGGATAPDCHFNRGGHGCHGGCYGGCYGCYGGCHGGCYGGGHGGCYGGCYGYSGHWHGGYSCHGCYGGGYNCYGCSGCWGGYSYSPYHVTPVVPGTPATPQPPPEVNPPVPNPGAGVNQVRSTLVVELPEDATLFVDGMRMKSVSAKRVFSTPPLQQGQTYYYDLKAEFEREGQVVNVTGRVVIRPGQEVSASLSEPSSQGTFVVNSR